MTIDVTNQTFDTIVLQSDKPVVVDFWAPWCGPCKVLGRVFESMSTEYSGVINFTKVNIDETDIAQKYSVRGVPTLMVFVNGQVTDTLVGLQSKADIASFLDKYTGPVAQPNVPNV